jgi:hypothetical protein
MRAVLECKRLLIHHSTTDGGDAAICCPAAPASVHVGAKLWHCAHTRPDGIRLGSGRSGSHGRPRAPAQDACCLSPAGPFRGHCLPRAWLSLPCHQLAEGSNDAAVQPSRERRFPASLAAPASEAPSSRHYSDARPALPLRPLRLPRTGRHAEYGAGRRPLSAAPGPEIGPQPAPPSVRRPRWALVHLARKHLSCGPGSRPQRPARQ